MAAADTDEAIRLAALAALENVAPEIHPHVVALCLDTTAAEHSRASVALFALGAKAAPAAGLVREHVRLALASIRSGTMTPPLALQVLPFGSWFDAHFKLLVRHLPDSQTVKLLTAAVVVEVSRTWPDITGMGMWEVRQAALVALRDLGRKHASLRQEVTKRLLEVLAKPVQVLLGLQIVRALGDLGPGAKEALPVLKKLRYHSAAAMRDAAVAAIKAIDR
jgi:hypothetical protein